MRELIQQLREKDVFKPASKKEVMKRMEAAPYKRFTFPLTLVGYGYDIDAAWEDAVDSFSQDPDGPTDGATAQRVNPDTMEEIGPEEKVT